MNATMYMAVAVAVAVVGNVVAVKNGQLGDMKRRDSGYADSTSVAQVDAFRQRFMSDGLKEIGNGAFGKVFKTIDMVTGKPAIVKMTEVTDDAANEVVIMKHVPDHQNIIGFLDSAIDVNEKFGMLIAMEYAPNGALDDKLPRGRKNICGWSDKQAREYFVQILTGVEFLHKNGVAHLDLKPDNIMLGRDGRVKIIDFGLAVKHDGNLIDPTNKGTADYRPPEALSKKKVLTSGEKFDVWSLGTILYQMLAGQMPEADEKQFRKNGWMLKFPDSLDLTKNKGPVPNMNCKLTAQAKALLHKMLVVDPAQRLSLKDVRSHPWVAKA
ncbi:Protein kinase domain-containing protein [Plasmodiophora brassicae]|uniref:Protein kinase domain-containing protein n=1 Tax=Plasmodiophora brassicae TaxID=37360 RepID=A0A0G4IRV5_PLABS|nr:hypothetical protein PBRA_006041 [Plasmodiophora brassicae]SPQ98143.1 unnamed protein product [Plasmodiophora brassicae]